MELLGSCFGTNNSSWPMHCSKAESDKASPGSANCAALTRLNQCTIILKDPPQRRKTTEHEWGLQPATTNTNSFCIWGVYELLQPPIRRAIASLEKVTPIWFFFFLWWRVSFWIACLHGTGHLCSTGPLSSLNKSTLLAMGCVEPQQDKLLSWAEGRTSCGIILPITSTQNL